MEQFKSETKKEMNALFDFVSQSISPAMRPMLGPVLEMGKDAIAGVIDLRPDETAAFLVRLQNVCERLVQLHAEEKKKETNE